MAAQALAAQGHLPDGGGPAHHQTLDEAAIQEAARSLWGPWSPPRSTSWPADSLGRSPEVVVRTCPVPMEAMAVQDTFGGKRSPRPCWSVRPERRRHCPRRSAAVWPGRGEAAMRRALPLCWPWCWPLALLTGCEFSLGAWPTAAPPSAPGVHTGLQGCYTKTTPHRPERYLYDQLLAGLQTRRRPSGDLYRRHGDDPDRHLTPSTGTIPSLFWFSGTGQIETTLLAGKPLRRPIRRSTPWTRPSARPPKPRSTSGQRTALPPSPGASDYDKALGVFYIIQHADYQVVDNNSIVNIMVGGAGLRLLCQDHPIPAGPAGGGHRLDITGQAQGESHAWNLAWLDGTPCWIDTHLGRPCLHRRGRQPGAGL